MVELGSGQFTYEVAEGWGILPDGWGFKEVAAVGADDKGNVYAFNRGGSMTGAISPTLAIPFLALASRRGPLSKVSGAAPATVGTMPRVARRPPRSVAIRFSP